MPNLLHKRVKGFVAKDRLWGNRRKLKALLMAADKHPLLKGFVQPWRKGNRKFIRDDRGEIVGFLTPTVHKGHVRPGAIWVHPEHRGKGYAGKAIKEFSEEMGDLPMHAFIHDVNEPSRKIFEAVGFQEGEREEEKRGTWFRKQPTYPGDKEASTLYTTSNEQVLSNDTRQQAFLEGYMRKLF